VCALSISCNHDTFEFFVFVEIHKQYSKILHDQALTRSHRMMKKYLDIDHIMFANLLKSLFSQPTNLTFRSSAQKTQQPTTTQAGNDRHRKIVNSK
jgi:hypothetical protein